MPTYIYIKREREREPFFSLTIFHRVAANKIWSLSWRLRGQVREGKMHAKPSSPCNGLR